ncbi:MAG TPA: 3-hydroxybutyryl-CoA dehydrogenase [Thermoanaerobaculia bacterium]|nr:3-hydroxybutyryl-CoA dehydrogenase [Thermoanaerobaculia bacterium]
MTGTEHGIERVGVAGCGLMGRGIAEVCALAGYRTVVREVEQGLLDRGLEAIARSLGKSVEKGRLEPAAAAAARERLGATLEVTRLAECDLVIEAIVENLDAKRALFQELDARAPPATLLASNTSSLTLTQLAASTGRGDRFLGLHFFNPVPAMRLVEVVGTLLTSEQTLALGRSFVESLGKTPVACKDNSGFIVNRLLVPYLLDAIRALENGVGSVEDIDVAMKLGCGYPMGPFTLLDFVGLDTVLFIADIMFDEYRERRFAPPPLLKQMVQAGRLGRKSGRGFYAHD